MQKSTKTIYDNIPHKNKKCKNEQKNCKNSTKRYKISQYNLSTTNIAAKLKRIINKQPDLFPEWNIYNNKDNLFSIGNIVAKSVNKCLDKFRGTKGKPLIELVAKDCVNYAEQNFANIEDYINNRYGFCNFYKKELKILPSLLIINMLEKIVTISKELSFVQANIVSGAMASKPPKETNSNFEKIYGYVKYNQNMLKISQISLLKIKKCVFYFIDKLNKTDKSLSFLVSNIIRLFNKYI